MTPDEESLAALVALDGVAKAFHRLDRQLDDQRKALHAAMIAATEAGASKSEIARRAGYTREYVAKIVGTDKDHHASRRSRRKRPE